MSPAPRSPRHGAEIDSDLWELAHDPDGGRALGVQVLGRLLARVPDDIVWRLERVIDDNDPFLSTAAFRLQVIRCAGFSFEHLDLTRSSDRVPLR